MLSTISEGPSGNITGQLILILVLIVLNAFFAASELAILSANPIRINMLAEKGNKKAILVQKLQNNETKFLSTIQVGITLAGFFSSATAAVSLSDGMASLLNRINVPYSSEVAVVIVTLILSYFTLVFGELFPKRIALKSPEKIAMLVARPINFIRIIFRPIVFILSGSCELLVKIFRLKPNNDDKVTEDEVKALVSSAVEDGTINAKEQEMIDAVFTFNDLLVKDVMKSRIDVFMINIDDPISKIKKLIKDEQYTRVPVYKDSRDNIIGILNLKDVFLKLKSNYTIEKLTSILRKPYFCVESMKAQKLLKDLQKSKEHCAIVIDDFGCVSGFVTMEDLIEEVIGNIFDEHDEIEESIVKLSDNHYLVDASLPIQDINKVLNINILRESEEYSTLGGYILYKLEAIPTIGSEVIDNNLIIRVNEMDNNRVIKAEIIINEQNDIESEETVEE